MVESGRRPAKERDGSSTREALVSAANDLFAERGFDGATVEAIATRAGVNKAMVSYHFAGKRGLYASIFERDLGSIEERVKEIGESARPADDKLRQFVSAFGSMHLAHPRWSSIMLREILSGGRNVDDRFLAVLGRIFGSLQAIVAQGVAEGTFREVDPLFTHHTIAGSIVFFFAARPFRDRMIAEKRVDVEAPDPEKFIAHVQQLLSRGLAKES